MPAKDETTRKMKSWRDECAYRGDVKRCPACRAGYRRGDINARGEPMLVLTTCQLYDAAGMGPGRYKRLAAIALGSCLASFIFFSVIKMVFPNAS